MSQLNGLPFQPHDQKERYNKQGLQFKSKGYAQKNKAALTVILKKAV